MHQPRPHGLHAEGGELTKDDAAFAEALARRLTNLKHTSGLQSLRMVRSLPDGGYVIAQDMGGVFRVISHKPEPPPDRPEQDGIAKPYIPMLFSGIIKRARVLPDEGVSINLTNQCRQRLGGYGEDGGAPGSVSLQRFVIPYAREFTEFAPKSPSVAISTQYDKQRPTWYSGAMAEVMQIVGGYGRQDFRELPDDPIEQARMILPNKVQRAIDLEQINVRLPGYTGMPEESGQFRYDYKFNNTHGVSFDSSGSPWLIQVSPAGVHAMPLPLIPATTTQAFREYIEEVGDREIEAILDRFGGMPSGEGFPAGGALEAWRRAGVVIKLFDTDDFYAHLAYSTACGWSFSLNGKEAINTCFDYDSKGIGEGFTFSISLNLGSADNSGKLPASWGDVDRGTMARLDRYLSGIYQFARENTPENLALKYKLRRVELRDLLSRAGSGADPRGEYEYWNNYEMEPIAKHEGEIRLTGEGKIFGGGQIKYPDPLMEGCISHDFRPIERVEEHERPKCDTIMFGYYIEDDLKVVRYFYDPDDGELDVVDDYEECMIVGSWERTRTSGKATIQGPFYTTDFDDRKLQAPTVTVEKIVGKDLGYDSQPWYSFAFVGWMYGSVWRNRYASRHVKRETRRDIQFSSAICIPFFSRNTVLYATSDATGSVTNSEQLSLVTVRDPNSYEMWTYDYDLHYFPLLILLAGGETWGNVPAEFFEEYGLGWMDTRPMPRDSYPVYAEIHNYSPGTCTEFADQGSWISVPEVISDIVPPKHKTVGAAGGGPPKLRTYSWTETTDREYQTRLKISIDPLPYLINEDKSDEPLNINRLYFYNSPDIFGTVFYIDSTKITFGHSRYSVVMESNGGPGFAHWGHTRLADHKSSPQFIGVINE